MPLSAVHYYIPWLSACSIQDSISILSDSITAELGASDDILTIFCVTAIELSGFGVTVNSLGQ